MCDLINFRRTRLKTLFRELNSTLSKVNINNYSKLHCSFFDETDLFILFQSYKSIKAVCQDCVQRGGSDWSGWSKVQGRTKTWTKKWTGGPFFSVLFLVMLGPFLSEFGPFLCRFGPFFINCTTKWTGILVFCSKFYRQDHDLTFK